MAMINYPSLYFIPRFRLRVSKEDITSLDEVTDISEKIKKLTERLEIPQEEYNERRAACAELREILRRYYPDCLLLMFGSTINGYGVKHCDLDVLFLPFPSYCNQDVPASEKTEPVPDPEKILSGETPRDILSKYDDWAHLKFIRAILKKEKYQEKLKKEEKMEVDGTKEEKSEEEKKQKGKGRKMTMKVNFIPAKSPSLKIYLPNHRTLIDLSATNKLVVYNSELLQFFSTIDPRVKPLVITLQFWARSMGFIKRSFFSSYGFTLLVVFYLQNINPPVLPTVHRLMELSGFSRMIAGWQSAFLTDLSKVPKTRNTQSLAELMSNFFEFYWNFDFAQNVISVFYGRPLPVAQLSKAQDKRLQEFEVASMNIQDPFVHSRNVCRVESSKIVFKLTLFTAQQILQDKSLKFQQVFDTNYYQKFFDSKYERYMLGRPKVCFITLDYACMLNLSKSVKQPHLFYEKAMQAIYDVFQYALLMECEVVDKVVWDKKGNPQRRNGFDKTVANGEADPYGLELLMSAQCTLYSRTWIGRKHITESTFTCKDAEEFKGPTLKAEYNISRELLEKNAGLNSPVPLLCFKVDCFRHTSHQIPDIIVMLRPLSVSREFYQVSAFLSSYIPKTVKRILSLD